MTDKPLSNPGGFDEFALSDAYAMAFADQFDGVSQEELDFIEKQGDEADAAPPRLVKAPKTETKGASHLKKRLLLRAIERAGRRLTDEQIDRAVHLLGS